MVQCSSIGHGGTGAFYGNLGFRFMGVLAQNFQNLVNYIF